MKSSKAGSLARPIAFFLVAVVLIFTIGFAAGGWQSVNDNQESSGEADNTNGNTDNNKTPDNETNDNEQEKPEIYIPKYESYLTGLEIDEEQYKAEYTALVMNSANPLYGLSSASMLIELPTETGKTRLIAYFNEKDLPTKLGTLAPTRKYIDNIAKYFGGILFCYGSDDKISYDGFDITESRLDVFERNAYHYTEYTYYAYTNRDLVLSGITSNDLISNKSVIMPFSFTDFGAQKIHGKAKANNIVIPFSDDHETDFTYSAEAQRYMLAMNGEVKKDLLNDKKTSFENVFVLFADSVTYESADASEMVLDTVSGGSGTYFTLGTSINIRWSTDADGNLLFLTESGEKLTANRGTSYIGFMKSSRINDVIVY